MNSRKIWAALAVSVTLAAPAAAQTAVSGATAGSTSTDSGVYRCAQTLGTLAVDDGRDQGWYRNYYRNTGVQSIEPLLRQIAQQSNCFVVTAAGNDSMNAKLNQIMQDQRDSGETRAGSNLQKGQRVAVDYFLQPEILYSGETTGDVSAVTGAIGRRLGIGGLGGVRIKRKETSVNMSMFSVRSGAQIAASTGSSQVLDISGAGGGLAGMLGGAAAGYTRTPEGKATVAAFVDAYNNMVVALENYEAQGVEGGTGTGGLLEVN